jgi:hypothetical protein
MAISKLLHNFLAADQTVSTSPMGVSASKLPLTAMAGALIHAGRTAQGPVLALLGVNAVTSAVH